MTIFGYHASHEQLPPSALLADVRLAEQAGFQAAMCSDHFAPWSRAQGHSGFAWSWLGAAMQATGLPFGCVNAPGQRYHPAIVAQAAATLAELFPGRFWVALGSGEALNEHITGTGWPDKQARNDRLLECVEVIRALFAGETVSHRGLVTVDRARLWSRPAAPPPLIGAAVSPETAGWVAGWADGLITVNQPAERLRRVVDAFRAGAARPSRCTSRSTWPTPRTRPRRWPTPTSSGAATCSTARWPGSWSCPSSSRRRPGTCGPTTSARRCWSRPTRRA